MKFMKCHELESIKFSGLIKAKLIEVELNDDLVRVELKASNLCLLSCEKPFLRGEKPSCCKLLLVPCWRHCLKSVITENSRIAADKETLKAEEIGLEKYFNENTKILESFQFLSGVVA
uniref:Uncharacterized protein n=1 Tax=Quercus lobata TaxID=97700 RepID=A0A7N2L8A6_QUELO